MASKVRIQRVLIANRGEIAVRLIRACREMGIESVAVYSDADRQAVHTHMADEARRLGPPPAAESYLDARKIVQIAQEAGCDAIHPGYGFLAESPRFAERVEECGLIFVGPGPESMRLMGDKIGARQTARKQGVPTIPGAYTPLRSFGEAQKAAEEIGYPLLIKAAAGGGGKGMRLVQSAQEMRSSFERAVSEVEKSFGDPSVYLERYIPHAKHIEVQILADEHGNTVHLYERECSVQRRYQKLIEETPALLLEHELRREMGEAAVAVARGGGYRNAGTVEFIFDLDREQYYFLEMNTRIQVEHPVTELTTGVDLVVEQLRVAGGEELGLAQNEIRPRGAAIECRIYAEDPEADFMPSMGRIEELVFPSGPGVRVDAGMARGAAVPSYYDPLLAKLIAWGPDRESAIRRMDGALRETLIAGITTTVGFHRTALADERFRRGDYTTDFVHGMASSRLSQEEQELLAVAAVLQREGARERLQQSLDSVNADPEGRWKWGRSDEPVVRSPTPSGGEA